MAQTSDPALRPNVSERTRWIQIIVGVVCMVATANIQYAWTLFVPEIQSTYGWDRASIQIAFTIFVLVQTWLTPIEGYFIDKYGPKVMVAVGAVCIGAAWIVNSQATSLMGFYVGAAIGGVGVGCIYATCINNALKWFPDRRGLAVGLTAGGYGAGSAATILPIAAMIQSSGFQETFFFFGILQGSLAFVAAWFLRSPTKEEVKVSNKLIQTRKDYTLKEALNTKLFWLMFLMFICVVTGGMMAVAQLGVIAQDLGVKNYSVNLYFFTMAALPLALMLDRVMNGISRPLFGWISDNIGREKTMVIAFTLEGLGIIALGYFGSNPYAFLILSGVVFLAWGEVYSLFSALAGDAFGTKHIGKIYGVLYCAKGIGALFVPVGNLLMEWTGTWATVLYTVAAMDLFAAFLAIVALRPVLAAHVKRSGVANPATLDDGPTGAGQPKLAGA
ncbi:OFA family oxalate/formate antiporter-like MFS transporter [Methylopila capsulata]|uniref:OFA family oxalate/formate antiporter-like MFS transporter n=1 Tax=Methylopila capsulata TaxID=61654 RepID=A0A9W6ITF5_9HYPH|nr:oxalate/formate MFS antiporter [Methylopila capsulata]MBM7850604.1 OFA family oxalate/formate antiporter-like MFS transporter [Methylopila capsulata]GLK55898.1 oxalate/formate MFS antiporter [Methylopila capsulata]